MFAFTFCYRIRRKMSSVNNSVLHLKGGVQKEEEKHLVQMEDDLFDL